MVGLSLGPIRELGNGKKISTVDEMASRLHQRRTGWYVDSRTSDVNSVIPFAESQDCERHHVHAGP